jgi:hypothetical protein
MHWYVIKAIEMFAAYCLFSRPLPIQSAVASGKEIDFIQDEAKLRDKRTLITTSFAAFATPLISYLSLPSWRDVLGF